MAIMNFFVDLSIALRKFLAIFNASSILLIAIGLRIERQAVFNYYNTTQIPEDVSSWKPALLLLLLSRYKHR